MLVRTYNFHLMRLCIVYIIVCVYRTRKLVCLLKMLSFSRTLLEKILKNRRVLINHHAEDLAGVGVCEIETT